MIIGVLLGTGLRCEELSNLTFDDVSQIPYGKTVKDVITIRGKGDKKRTIPMDPVLAKHIREWKMRVKSGRVARRMLKGKKIGKSITPRRISDIVREYGYILGIEDLAPHDLRRTYGRIMYYANNRDIVLVKNLLGHKNTRTTEGYIGVDLNLDIDVFPVGGLQVVGRFIKKG